jgi:hypothetical protein
LSIPDELAGPVETVAAAWQRLARALVPGVFRYAQHRAQVPGLNNNRPHRSVLIDPQHPLRRGGFA